MSKQPLLVRVEPEHHSRVKVFVPWQRKDWVQQIKSLPNRAWNKKKSYWSVPKSVATFQHLAQLFGENLKIAEGLIIPKEAPTIEEKPPIHLPNNCIIAIPEHLADSKAAYQKEKGIPTATKNNILPAKYFKTIQQGERTFKVFIGEKIILQKANEEWLQLWVAYDKKEWIEIVKNIPGRKWESEGKYWCIPYAKDSLKRLWQLIGQQHLQYSFDINSNIPDEFMVERKQKIKTAKFKLNDMQQKAITALEDRLLIERCSWRTIKSYRSHLRNLLLTYPNEKPSNIKAEKIQAYILKQIKTKKISESTQNQLINALKAFYERVCNQTDKVKSFIRPKKKPKKLPNILSKQEVENLLKCIQNIKHKAMLSLIYAAGLRKGELINLRKKDILFSRKCIFVKNAKGKKDRIVMLSPKIENMLHQYIKIHSPKYWLFEGQTRGQYSETSLQNIFTKAKRKSDVNPYITIHGLRHSFATHLHEAGVPLNGIKDLLGHNSIKTTEIYLHLSNKFLQQIQSPLDFLNLD